MLIREDSNVIMLSKESLGILDEQQDPQPANVTDSEQNELDQHSDHEGLEAFEPLNVGSDALNNDIFGGLSDNLVYAAGDWRHERVQDWNLSNQSFEFQVPRPGRLYSSKMGI